MCRLNTRWILIALAAMLMLAGVAGAATVTIDTGTGKGAVSKTFSVDVVKGSDGTASFVAPGALWEEGRANQVFRWEW